MTTADPEKMPDWKDWHDGYDRPDSGLARRLVAVRERIRVALDAASAGPLRAVSLCAGQGRDLIGVLHDHPRAGDVTARLVELDPRNAEVARSSAQAAGLNGVEVVVGDAAVTDQYAGLAPAYLVLVCGVFGNIDDADIERTIGFCGQLCARGGTVVWTRGRFEPDLVPQICEWFEERGFARLWVSEPDARYGVGAHRSDRDPSPLEPGERMFTFTRHGGSRRSGATSLSLSPQLGCAQSGHRLITDSCCPGIDCSGYSQVSGHSASALERIQ